MYMTSWEARKIVDIPVNDAFRLPFKLLGISDQDAKVLMKMYSDLDVEKQFRRAYKQQRLLGGCCLYMGIADAIQQGDSPEDAVRIERIDRKRGAIEFVNLVDINEITANRTSFDPLEKDFSKTDSYFIRGRRVHRSRLIVMDGENIADWRNMVLLHPNGTMPNPAGFSESILTPLYDIWVRVTGTQEGAYHLVNMASVLLATCQELKGLSATKAGEKALAKMQELVNSISMYRGAILDGDAQITQHSASFGSVPELLMVFLQILSAASDIPAVRFLGQAPGGLNATGISDLETHYNFIAQWQNSAIKPNLLKFFDVAGVCAFGRDLWSKMRREFNIEFPPLWSLRETDKAALAVTWINAYSPLWEKGAMCTEAFSQELKARGVFMTDVDLLDAVEATREDLEHGRNDDAPIDADGELATLSKLSGPISGSRSRVHNARFDESKIDRDEDGKFSSGGGGGGASGDGAAPAGEREQGNAGSLDVGAKNKTFESISDLFDVATEGDVNGKRHTYYGTVDSENPVDEENAKFIQKEKARR